MHQTSFHLLAENEHGYIGVCSCCREFTLAYNNFALTFPEDDMFRFCDWLAEGIEKDDYIFPLRHGKHYVFPSPLDNFCLCFNPDEIEDIVTLVVEAKLVLEARRIVMYN